MRNLIFAINTTLDGCCDHTKQLADDTHEYFTHLLQDVDLLVFGRKTYQLMVPFWPEVARTQSDLWRKLRTTNVIDRCFVEVRRRTRPMVCFVNVESVDRIIDSIFQGFNPEWKTRPLNLFTEAA